MNETQDNTTPSVEPDLSGRQIGDYLILRRLGRGGMAEVYLAQQQSLDRPVAFKVLRHNLAVQETYRRRFLHEARAAANLVQSNIVQIYDVGESEGVHYIAQEYIQGQNVKQYLKRHGSIDVFLVINIMRQVTAALHKASDQGVIHRDIKPENIMLASSGEVKVADFGLARIERLEANDLTQVGITMGTPLYMSPEQVEGSKVDPRSDIYSFGVTAYEMISGRPPFEAETALSLAVKHLNEEPTPLEQVRPDLPYELCEIIRKMMAKRPADRFQSPAELLRNLREVQLEETDERWAETLHQLSLTDGQVLASTAHSYTERLGTLMRQQKSARPSKVGAWISSLLIILLIGFGLGTVISMSIPAEDPLFVEQGELEQIPKRENVAEQYRLAYQLRSERAWQAVMDYFPATDGNRNRYYGRLASVRLGEFYLRESQYNDALNTFATLQNVEPTEREFRLIGLAGMAISYSRMDNRETATRQTMLLFDESLSSYNRSLDQSIQWEEFFDNNEFLRSLFAELRRDLNWPEPDQEIEDFLDGSSFRTKFPSLSLA